MSYIPMKTVDGALARLKKTTCYSCRSDVWGKTLANALEKAEAENARLKAQVGRLREKSKAALPWLVKYRKSYAATRKVNMSCFLAIQELEKALSDTPDYLNEVKAEVLETAKKEFVTSCSAQEDMMVLVRRWEARIEDFHSKGRERVT